MLELALEDLNQDGGVLGRRLVLETADTASKPEQGSTAALDVLDAGAEMVMVTCDFDFGSPAAFAAVERGVLAFSSCAAGLEFGVEGIGPLAYTLSTSTPGQAATMAEWAFHEQGYRTGYVLTDQSLEYPKDLSSMFVQHFTDIAGPQSILGTDGFEIDDTNFAAHISRYNELPKEPDFIFLATGSYAESGPALVRQLRAAGIDVPLLSAEAFDGDFWLDAVPDLSDFYYATYASIFGDDPDPAVNELFDRYEEKYGERPPLGNSVTGYSVGEAFAIAAERAGTTEGQALAEALDTFEEEPLLVGPTTFTPELHANVQRPMRVMEIQNGKHSFLMEYVNKQVPESE
jgi:branched-chain amino acid transport system substrate-binding protein